MGLILCDTTFFVDLHREQKRGKKGPATRILAESPGEELAMSVITRGELARGFDDIEAWSGFCVGFLVPPLDNETLWAAGVLFNRLRDKGFTMSDNDLWIAKFSRRDDRWNFPRVEHGLLRLAEACGLDVADSRLETAGGRDILLVRRFDRDWVGAGFQRHRMVSALTLLRAGDAPSERGDWSYLLLADEIRRASARPEEDLRELFRRACFNAAVSNLDDHPRNHALVAKRRHWRLSPAFDLTPSPIIARDRRDLAMVCGRFGRYANRANLLSEHGRFLLGAEAAAALFEQITTTVRAQWYPAMRRAGVSNADCQAIRNAFLYDGLFYEQGR